MIIMIRRTFAINRWFITLASVLLIGFLSMPNHMTVLTMHMERHRVSSLATSPNGAVPEHEETHHLLSYFACGPLCIFMFFQSVSAIPCGDNVKIVNSTPVFQSAYIKSIIPPPKA
jgi:hypothetical protein